MRLGRISTYYLIGIAVLAAAASFAGASSGTNPNKAGEDRSVDRPGYLGVRVEKMTPEDKAELKAAFGVVITDVVDDSPADRADLREEDVIQSINGNEIRNPDDLAGKVREIGPRAEIRIGIVRDGKRQEIKAETGRLRRSDGDLDGENQRVFRMTFPGSRRLGARLTALNDDLAEYFKVDEGALVLEVEEDGPAGRAGLKAGDVIIRVEDEDVSEPEDVSRAVSDMDDGEDAELTVVRKGVKQTLEVGIEQRWTEPSYRNRRSGFGPGPGFDIQIEMDEESQERLKEQLENLQEKLEGGMDRLKQELEELDDTTRI
jgi:S1-C subfamily serine protease